MGPDPTATLIRSDNPDVHFWPIASSQLPMRTDRKLTGDFEKSMPTTNMLVEPSAASQSNGLRRRTRLARGTAIEWWC
jgi:hypothetical protein